MSKQPTSEDEQLVELIAKKVVLFEKSDFGNKYGSVKEVENIIRELITDDS